MISVHSSEHVPKLHDPEIRRIAYPRLKVCRANDKSGAGIAADEDGAQQTSLLLGVEKGDFRGLEQHSVRVVEHCDIMPLLRTPLAGPTSFWGPEIIPGAGAIDFLGRSHPVSGPLPPLNPRMYPVATHDLAFPA